MCLLAVLDSQDIAVRHAIFVRLVDCSCHILFNAEYNLSRDVQQK